MQQHDAHVRAAYADMAKWWQDNCNDEPRGDKDMPNPIPNLIKAIDDAYYQEGTIAPHYPVPAIRLEVDICKTWDNTVAIFDKHDFQIVYIR